MVAGEMESTKSNSTALSASNRTVHLAYPSGASLQAKAMIWASTSPSIFEGVGGVSLTLRDKNSVMSFEL